MAGLTIVEEGDGIPIVLQLADGNTGLYPQAVITADSGDLLDTINLTHVTEGLYQTVFTMTDDPYINATFIVYTDAGHTIESTIYQRDVDTFLLIIPSEYKATGFAVPNEYDLALAEIQSDLDDPDQYKATGFATLNPPSQNLDDYKADIGGENIEGTLDLQDAIRIILAAVAGSSAGAGTNNFEYKSIDGSIVRIRSSFDSQGNRQILLIDAS
jgi:hypothetical protein